MIKNLLTIIAVTSTMVVSAQTGRIAKTRSIQANAATSSIALKSALPLCDTLSILTGTGITLSVAGSDTATPGCSPKAGWVCGTNCYGDTEKAAWFASTTYSTLSGPQVVGAIVGFYKDGPEGTGGVGTNTVGVKIYVNSGFTAGPGAAAALGTASLPLSTIIAGFSSTVDVSYVPFTFPSAINVSTLATSGFWASLVLPNQNATDTAVVVQQSGATVNNSWEKWNTNSWNNMNTAWGGGFYRMAIFPIINCAGGTVGLKNNSTNDNLVYVMPNPTEGMLNVLSTLNDASTVRVTDALGREIMVKNHNPALGPQMELDLSNQSNGVYFITISNASYKTVKRVVLNK